MKKEIVNQSIENLSGGNKCLEIMLKEISLLVQEPIKRWPDSAVPKLERNLKRGVESLLRKRISFNEIQKDPEGFWKSEQGKAENKLLKNYIVPRLNRNNE